MLPPKGLLKFLKVDGLLQNLTEYIETRIALVKVEIKDEIAKAMRAALIYVAMAFIGLFFLIFFSLTIALVLNYLLESTFWGFVIVTAVYLIALISLYSLRNSPKVKAMFIDGSTKMLKEKEKKAAKKVEKKPVPKPASPDFERAHVDFGNLPATDRPAETPVTGTGNPAYIPKPDKEQN